MSYSGTIPPAKHGEERRFSLGTNTSALALQRSSFPLTKQKLSSALYGGSGPLGEQIVSSHGPYASSGSEFHQESMRRQSQFDTESNAFTSNPEQPKSSKKADGEGSPTPRHPPRRVPVLHDYHDNYRDPLNFQTVKKGPDTANVDDSTDGRKESRAVFRGGVSVHFPERLFEMLEQVDLIGMAHVVSWQPHGRAFLVHRPQEFVAEVMPRFFRQSKFTSFQRQLNLYGFVRLSTGRDCGSYYHECFLQGCPALCRRIVRRRIKGNGVKPVPSPSTEPDFYNMEWCEASGPKATEGEQPRPTVHAKTNREHSQFVPCAATSTSTGGFHGIPDHHGYAWAGQRHHGAPGADARFLNSEAAYANPMLANPWATYSVTSESHRPFAPQFFGNSREHMGHTGMLGWDPYAPGGNTAPFRWNSSFQPPSAAGRGLVRDHPLEGRLVTFGRGDLDYSRRYSAGGGGLDGGEVRSNVRMSKLPEDPYAAEENPWSLLSDFAALDDAANQDPVKDFWYGNR